MNALDPSVARSTGACRARSGSSPASAGIVVAVGCRANGAQVSALDPTPELLVEARENARIAPAARYRYATSSLKLLQLVAVLFSCRPNFAALILPACPRRANESPG